MIGWLEEQWHLAGVVCAVILIALLPIWLSVGAGALTVVYLQLPIYQVHQLEEHHRDRFRTEFNRSIGRGREALSRRAVLVANVVGVWALMLAALYLAAFVDLSLGLAAIYLPLVNAMGHLGAGVLRRRYNPGLVTSVVLFLGVGVPSLLVVADASGAGIAAHALGLTVAVAAHAVLLAHVRRRLAAGAGVSVLPDDEAPAAVVLVPRAAIKARLRSIFGDVGTSMREDLIADRRSEAAREESGGG